MRQAQDDYYSLSLQYKIWEFRINIYFYAIQIKPKHKSSYSTLHVVWQCKTIGCLLDFSINIIL